MATTITTLRGFLGNNPEPITSKGTDERVGLSFRVATTERYRDTNGEWQDRGTDWFTVKVWGNLAENCYHSVHKGDPVFATGRLRMETWTNAEGAERSAMVLTASAVGLDLNRCTVVKRSSIQQEERKRKHDPAEGPSNEQGRSTDQSPSADYEMDSDADSANPDDPF